MHLFCSSPFCSRNPPLETYGRGFSALPQTFYSYSPIIGKGQADILVSFETMEALRWLEYLAPTGKVVVNDYQIPSAPILMGKREYPAGVLELLKEKADTTVICAALIAERLGNAKAMNVVLFGALVKAMKIDYIDWEEVIKTSVKASAVPVNLLAFQEGLKVK